MHARPYLLLLGALLLTSAWTPLASGQPAYEIAPFQDLLFTDTRRVNDLVPLGDGYAAATGGGLVLWNGDGPRQVLTRSDGLPSNIVWSLAWTGDELLLGTEFGLALVDPLAPDGPTVRAVEAPHEVVRVTEDNIAEVRVTPDGRWVALDRGGELATRAPDGTWSFQKAPPRVEATALYVDEEVTIVGMRPAAIFSLADDGSWDLLTRPKEKPEALQLHQGVLYAGIHRGGLVAYDLDGNRQSLDTPERIDPDIQRPNTVLTLESFAGELWIGTVLGYVIHNATEASWREVPDTEIPNRWVEAIVPLASRSQGAEQDEALLGTLLGVMVPDFESAPGLYQVHTTLNGPSTNAMRGLNTVRDREVWVATQKGVSAYFPEVGTWLSLTKDHGLPFELVNSVEFDEDTGWLWFATMGGVVGLDLARRTWTVLQDQQPITLPGNVYLDIELDGRYIWMPENQNGLLRHDRATNDTHRFDIQHGLLSRALTCADRWHEFLVVCAQDVMQLFNLSLANNQAPLGPSINFCSGPRCDNYPANQTWNVLPDGPRLWVATRDAGLALIERHPTEGAVVTGHWDRDDGLPSVDVRSLHPAPDGVWVGTLGGLARVDRDEGVVDTWGRDAGLDDPAVNGLTIHGDVLYASTLSGLYRLDLNTETFLPLYQGEGTVTFEPPDARLRITFPPPRAVLGAPVNMTGEAEAPGRAPEGVEVRIDDGDWEQAAGIASWRYRLPIDELAPGDHLVQVRVVEAGEPIAEATRTITVREATEPTVPPSVDHEPPKEVLAGTVLELEGTVQATEPIDIIVDATVGGTPDRVSARVLGETFTATVPIPEGARGDVTYQFQVRSGGGEATLPQDGLHLVPIIEPRVRKLTFELDEAPPLELAPGEEASLSAWVENRGNRAEDLTVLASGLRPSWMELSTPTLLVPPDARVGFNLTVAVPQDALPSSSILLLTVQTDDGAGIRTVSVPVNVTGVPEPAPPPGDRGTPATGGPLVALALAGAALALARRRWEP